MSRLSQDFEQVSGIFSGETDLERLLIELENRGLDDEDVSVLMSENTREKFFSAKDATKAPEGATIGGISGGIVGGIIGGLTLVGSLLIPGAGLLAVGPIVGVLAGITAGGALGGLVGALIGAGIPEHEAKFYEDALKEEGNVLVVAHVIRELGKETRLLFERFGAKQIKVHH